MRNYVEKELGAINLEEFPKRPADKIDLSIGDPTNSADFRTHSSNLDILKANVGVIDGYTEPQGHVNTRKAIATHFPSKHYSTD